MRTLCLISLRKVLKPWQGLAENGRSPWSADSDLLTINGLFFHTLSALACASQDILPQPSHKVTAYLQTCHRITQNHIELHLFSNWAPLLVQRVNQGLMHHGASSCPFDLGEKGSDFIRQRCSWGILAWGRTELQPGFPEGSERLLQHWLLDQCKNPVFEAQVIFFFTRAGGVKKTPLAVGVRFNTYFTGGYFVPAWTLAFTQQKRSDKRHGYWEIHKTGWWYIKATPASFFLQHGHAIRGFLSDCIQTETHKVWSLFQREQPPLHHKENPP